jgi:ABC-type nickel/cobalt efflux system permease component RcnA
MTNATGDSTDTNTPGTTTAILTTLAAVGSFIGLAVTIQSWTATKVLAYLLVVLGEVLVAIGLWMTYEDFQDRRPAAIVAAAKAAVGQAASSALTPDQIKANEAAEAEAHMLVSGDVIRGVGEAINAAAEGLSKLRPAAQLIVLGLIALTGSAALLRLTP